MKPAITTEHFVGTWTLLSCEHHLADGRTTYPMGPAPKGILVYTAEGYMTGALMDPRRPKFQAADLFGGTPDEKSAAMEGYVHYAGKFEVQEDRVIHHVEMSLFPNWVGSRQQRFFKFHDDKMELFTNAFVSEGISQTAHLLWQRATSS